MITADFSFSHSQDSDSNSVDSDEDLFNSVDDPLFSFNPPTLGKEENFEESGLNISSDLDFDYISLDSPGSYSDLDDPPPTLGKAIMELYESSTSDSEENFEESWLNISSLDSPGSYSDLDDPHQPLPAMKGLKRAVPEDSILTQPEKKNRQDLIYGHHPDHELGFDSHSTFQGSSSTQRDNLPLPGNPGLFTDNISHLSSKDVNLQPMITADFSFSHSQDSDSNSVDSDEDLFNSVDDPFFSFNPPTLGKEENFEESGLNNSSNLDFDYISFDSPGSYSDLDDPPPTLGKAIMELYESSTSDSEENFEESWLNIISRDSPGSYSDLDDPPPTPGKSIMELYESSTSDSEENFEESWLNISSLDSPGSYSDLDDPHQPLTSSSLDDPPPTLGKAIMELYESSTSDSEENFEESWLNISSLDSPGSYSDLDDPPPTPGKSIMELYESSTSDSDKKRKSASELTAFDFLARKNLDKNRGRPAFLSNENNNEDDVSDEEAEKSSSDEGYVGDQELDLVISDETNDNDTFMIEADERGSDGISSGNLSNEDECMGVAISMNRHSGDSSDEDEDSSDEDEDSSDEDEDNDVSVEELCMHRGRVPTKEMCQKREQQLNSLRDSLTSPSYLTCRHMIQAPLCSCCGYPMPVSPLASPAKPFSHPCNLQRRLSKRRPVITLWLELMTTSYHQCRQEMEGELQVSEEEEMDMIDFYAGCPTAGEFKLTMKIRHQTTIPLMRIAVMKT
ncbi:dentin sialophosphoprotein-like [Littorina saxatilis]|uniref:dentin sialophosphoprotein-like n=1 Tax=Littorina saxatilis TaxID=31220 RepID=UPI0038B5160B